MELNYEWITEKGACILEDTTWMIGWMFMSILKLKVKQMGLDKKGRKR